MLKKFLVASAVLTLASAAYADCSFNIAGGKMRLSGLGPNRVDAKLTTRYTSVERQVNGKATIGEAGIECELGYGFALSLSEVWGIKASIDRDVRFSGYNSKYGNIGGFSLFHVNEEASARAMRVSALKYVDFGSVAPAMLSTRVSALVPERCMPSTSKHTRFGLVTAPAVPVSSTVIGVPKSKQCPPVPLSRRLPGHHATGEYGRSVLPPCAHRARPS